MRFKSLVTGAGAFSLLLLAAFFAGGISLGASHAQSALSSGAAKPAAQAQVYPAGKFAATNQLAPAQGAIAQANTPQPTEVPAAAEPTEVARAAEPTEVAGADEPVGTAEPTEVAGTAEPAGGDNEAADAAALAGQVSITARQAEQAALAANPGTTVVKTDLGDENGTIVYDVELSNGSDVKVDARSGAILGTDTAGSESGENAQDGSTQEGQD